MFPSFFHLHLKLTSINSEGLFTRKGGGSQYSQPVTTVMLNIITG